MAKGGAKGGLASEPPPPDASAPVARVAEPHATAVFGAPSSADAMAEIAEPPTPRDDFAADGDDDALMMAEEPVAGDDDHQAKRARMLQQGDANVPEPPPSQPLFESLRDSLFGPSAPIAEGSAALVEEGDDDDDEYDDVQSRSTHDAYGDDFDETETLGSRSVSETTMSMTETSASGTMRTGTSVVSFSEAASEAASDAASQVSEDPEEAAMRAKETEVRLHDREIGMTLRALSSRPDSLITSETTAPGAAPKDLRATMMSAPSGRRGDDSSSDPHHHLSMPELNQLLVNRIDDLSRSRDDADTAKVRTTRARSHPFLGRRGRRRR